MAKNTRIAFFLICDIICFNVSYLLAFLINAAASPDQLTTSEAAGYYFDAYPAGFLVLIAVKVAAMLVSSAYKIVFDYAGFREYRRVALSLLTSTLASVTVAAIIGIELALLPPIILISFVFDAVLIMAVRALYVRQTGGRREAGEQEGQGLRQRYASRKNTSGRVMIIGANRSAVDLISEMQANESLGRKPEIIIDDDKSHDGDILLGIEIVAKRSEIRLRARRQSIDEIIIVKPDASKRQLAALLRECVKTRCKISMLPLTRESRMASQLRTAALADLRKPTIGDLLGRDRPRVDHRLIGDELKGRIVLVTGGAGVFGAELCRRIIRYKPRRLIALDIDEDGLALLITELEGFRTAETEFLTVIASVRDGTIMRRVFGAFRPHIVFHAAELKQIPFAQTHPREAFLTNVLGLKTSCDLADEFSAEKFILCSTVRAANPTNVAAQCKRTAELYINEKNEKSHTMFATVRFPNLIEGEGNVIKIFEKQLEKGGPLTVTDKDIGRRFIGVEETAVLTVLAATRTTGGEIFELGPGEAFGIRELAEAVIRLDGKIPYEDVDIVVTQLRAGERLFEDVGAASSFTTPSQERILAMPDRSGLKLPHWSQLWPKDPERLDDATVIEILRLIFPTYKNKSIDITSRGVKVENE